MFKGVHLYPQIIIILMAPKQLKSSKSIKDYKKAKHDFAVLSRAIESVRSDHGLNPHHHSWVTSHPVATSDLNDLKSVR